jgi:hypothetical protein
MKPSGGGGEYVELIFKICATNVGSFGIQFPLMTRHPEWNLIDVYAATILDFPFKPGVHVNYEATVLRMVDQHQGESTTHREASAPVALPPKLGGVVAKQAKECVSKLPRTPLPLLALSGRCRNASLAPKTAASRNSN